MFGKTLQLTIEWDAGMAHDTKRWLGRIVIKEGLLLRILPLGWVEICPPFEWLAHSDKPGGLCIALEVAKTSEIELRLASGTYVQKVSEILKKGELTSADKKLRFHLVKQEPATVKISPSAVTAGKTFTPELTIKVGKKGIKEYGGIRVLSYQRTDWHIGMIEARTSRRGIRTEINKVDITPDIYSSYNEIGEDVSFQMFSFTLNIRGGDLKEGDRVFVRMKSSRAQTFVDDYVFLIYLDSKAENIFAPAESVHIAVKPGRYDHLRLTIPSTVKKGRRFNAGIQGMDRYNNVCSSLSGKIELFFVDAEMHNIGAKKSLRITKGSGNAGLTVPGKFTGKVVYLKAEDKGCGKFALSNPSLLVDGRHDVYWGSLHTHTYLSDGYGSPDFAYRYARDVSRLDFAAISDHNTNITPNKWEITKDVSRRYHKPGKFVTFLAHAESAFRWCGSVNCYYLEEDEVPRHEYHRIYYGPRNMDFVQPLYYKGNLHEQLKKLAQQGKVLLISHIHGGQVEAVDFRYLADNAAYCPLLEIYSEWGAKEYPGNPWLPSPEFMPEGEGMFTYRKVLARGIRVGAVGDGDDHVSMPGSLNINPHKIGPSIWKNSLLHPAGITAVFAKDLTRKSLFEALRARRCYATTTPRILLNFSIAGHMMGEDLSLRKYRRLEKGRKVEVLAAAAAGLTVEIIRNNAVIKCVQGKYAVQIDYFDDTPFDDIALEDTNGKRFIFYYIRVTRKDGHQAWSSPVWLSK